MDISRYSIDELKRRVPGAKAIVGGADKLGGLRDGYFDVITAIDVLEHIEGPEDVVRSFHRKLRPDGVLLINVPNTESIGRKWKGEKWFAYRDRSHRSILQPDQWMDMLKAQHFSIKDVYYDGLWDSPYLPGIPGGIQHLMFKLPSVALMPFIRFTPRFGENICIISQRR